jgi:hypothetical protein
MNSSFGLNIRLNVLEIAIINAIENIRNTQHALKERGYVGGF